MHGYSASGAAQASGQRLDTVDTTTEKNRRNRNGGRAGLLQREFSDLIESMQCGVELRSRYLPLY